jgi:Concanavalin A-like lectin/glucanases superfamily
VPLADYVAEVLADDPEVYWQCQESSGLLQDSSGNAFHANSDQGGVTYGLAGPCGDDDAIAIAGASPKGMLRNAVPFTAVDNVTFEWWFWNVSMADTALAYMIGNTTNTGIYFSFTGTPRKPRISVAGVAHLATFANEPPVGAWTHLVAVRRATSWEYYFNGTADTLGVSTATPTAPDTQTWIGGFGAAVDYRVAHVAAYDTALTIGRIADHYNAATEAVEAGGSVNWHALGMR